MPYKYEDTNYGRFTKGLANTLLLKFYMMTKQWDEAEKIGRELTKSEYGYKLADDYNSLFSLSGEKNSEVIFSCVAEAGVMEQKWFAHVLTSDYPLPAGMSVTCLLYTSVCRLRCGWMSRKKTGGWPNRYMLFILLQIPFTS